MRLFSKDDVRDLVILFSVPSLGILFSTLHKYMSWAAGSDYQFSCGRARPEGERCVPDFLRIAVDLLEIWAISLAVTVVPLLALVTVLVILVRWICSLGAPAEKH